MSPLFQAFTWGWLNWNVWVSWWIWWAVLWLLYETFKPNPSAFDILPLLRCNNVGCLADILPGRNSASPWRSTGEFFWMKNHWGIKLTDVQLTTTTTLKLSMHHSTAEISCNLILHADIIRTAQVELIMLWGKPSHPFAHTKQHKP